MNQNFNGCKKCQLGDGLCHLPTVPPFRGNQKKTMKKTSSHHHWVGWVGSLTKLPRLRKRPSFESQGDTNPWIRRMERNRIQLWERKNWCQGGVVVESKTRCLVIFLVVSSFKFFCLGWFQLAWPLVGNEGPSTFPLVY